MLERLFSVALDVFFLIHNKIREYKNVRFNVYQNNEFLCMKILRNHWSIYLASKEKKSFLFSYSITLYALIKINKSFIFFNFEYGFRVI